MSDSNHDEIVANFTTITGVDAERAKFYLESAGWNLDVAMSTFYQEDDEVMDEPIDVDAETAPPSAAAQPPPPVAPQKPKIATLSNYGAAEAESGSDSEDSDEGQRFYAGGSERSGQQIIGPPKKKADKIVKDVFSSAQKHGAEVVEPGGSSGAPPRGNKPTFRGTGYRLGETEEAPLDMVQGAPIQQQGRNVDMVLKMWKNGFSISDGPLRDYSDPASVEFINYIKKGEIPPELTRMAKGGEVNLDMEDHRTEEYVRPKAAARPFGGEGMRLGSAVPPVATVTSPTKSASQESAAKSAVSVDASQPTTNVQIRLADGQRLVAKFNHTHTVADIRLYIETAHPQYVAANYALMTTFPNRELTDASESLEQAKLLSSAIVQRMK